MMAIQEARALWPGRPIGCMVSLGVGEPIAANHAKAGLTYWLGQMKSIVVETYRTHKEVQAALTSINGPEAPRPHYCRLQPIHERIPRLDECRERVLDGMRRATSKWLASKDEKVHHACSVLSALSQDGLAQSPKISPLSYAQPHLVADSLDITV